MKECACEHTAGQKCLKHINKNKGTDCHHRGKTLQRKRVEAETHTHKDDKSCFILRGCLAFVYFYSLCSVSSVCCCCKKYIGHAVVCQCVHHPSSSAYQGSQKRQAKFGETHLEYDEALKRLHVLGFNISLW